MDTHYKQVIDIQHLEDKSNYLEYKPNDTRRHSSRQQQQQQLSGQTDRSTSSKMLACGFSCNIHSQHIRKGEDRKDGGEAQVPLSVQPQLPTTTTSHSCSFRFQPVILGGITNRTQGFKFNQSAVYGNLQQTSNYLEYKLNFTRRHEHVKYCGLASTTSSSATGPTHLERGQLIWKIQKERLTITIVGCHFSQLVWNMPSSSTCGRAPAHLERGKRED